MALPRLRIGILGRLVVDVDDRPAQLTPTNVRMLIRLVVGAGHPVTLEQLYRDVWNAGAGHPISRENRTQVQRQIGELRRILAPSRPSDLSRPDDLAEVITTERGATSAYRLVVARDQVDAWAFADLVDLARAAGPDGGDLAARALTLWRGDPLIDVAAFEFAQPHRLRYEQLRTVAQRSLMAAYVHQGLTAQAQSLGQELIAADADDHEARGLLDKARRRAANDRRILLRHDVAHPRIAVVVEAGDLLSVAPGADLVVGFTDTFDTSTRDDMVISRNSVQGQVLLRLYGDNRDRLDQDLRRALAGVRVVRTETKAAKPRGKRGRYPIGTVAVLRDAPRRIFGVAYSRMGNDLVARSTVEDLAHSLDQLWSALYQFGQFGDVVMPLVGSGLSRINSASHQDLLELIILSFLAASARLPVCRELRVVVSEPQLEKVSIGQLERLLAAPSARHLTAPAGTPPPPAG